MVRFLFMMFLILLILKLTAVQTLSWAVVFLPIWLPTILVIFLVLLEMSIQNVEYNWYGISRWRR